jgi:hypothetical protein
MRIARVLALVCILPAEAGCSATDEAAPETWRTSEGASGTRLRARFLTAGDVREHAGFFDTRRAEECTFQAAEGEHVRCLPPTQSYVAGTAFFADPACKTPIAAFGPQGCGTAKYAIATAYDPTTCAQAPLELRRVLGPATVFQNAGTGCAPVQTPLVTVGDVVPWTEFVEGVPTSTPGATDALGESLLVGDDGARQHVGFRSTKLDENCVFQVMADGVARCVPEGRRGPVYFSDAACVTPTAVLVNGGASCGRPTPEHFLLPDPSALGASCDALRGVHELVEYAASASSELYLYNPTTSTTTDATCSSVSSLGGAYGQERRGLGADLTPSLPVATRVSGRSGRLVPALVSKDDTRTLEPGWHDNERDTDCTFMVASDGRTRCLPTGGQARLFFGDNACKAPSRVAAPTKPSCGAPGSAFALVTSGTCPSTTRVFALGTERRDLPSASTETAPGRCVRVTSLSGGLDATEIDPTQFVEGTLVTE